MLSFDKTVALASVMFSYVDAGDTFDIFVDTNDDGILERLYENIAISGSGYVSVDLLSYNLVGKLFGIGTSSYQRCTSEWVRKNGKWKLVEKCSTFSPSWKLKKVVFEEVPEVPLPAALPLFLAGIAGLGFAGRKKNA